ncbi:MAG: flagellin FliC [Candidatus Melainabacteria bacterium]|nr:MAG: flagellin FliC [Candidatus Melainabacteria bacterium]RAI12130.1 MAG: flagellin FliC [Candidatus Melainabacteria bacterium]
MAITVNTNIPSLTAQKSLNSATSKMNQAMERMTTGLKINSSKDDAAGLAVANKLDYQVSSLKVAQDNAQMGSSMLDTMEGVMTTINDNLTRIRDLTEQAANGTYGSDAMAAIKAEVNARLAEIDRVAKSTEFNGKKLLDGSTTEVNLQVGLDKTDNSVIKLDDKIFQDSTRDGLGINADVAWKSDTEARNYLETIDKAIEKITNAKTAIGGKQAAITSAMESANVMATNLTSASALIKDADIAEESSNYIKQQILQQTSASLLATANQAPSIALNLV